MRLTYWLSLALPTILATCSDAPTAPNPGSLAVVIGGLPAAVQPSVTVSGPNAFSVVVASSTTLTDLKPGIYTVVAADVTSGNVRFAAVPATQTVTVFAGAQATASSVTYAVASARLTVSILGL